MNVRCDSGDAMSEPKTIVFGEAILMHRLNMMYAMRYRPRMLRRKEDDGQATLQSD